MKVGQHIVNCAYTGMTAAEVQSNVNDNQENTGYLAVTIKVGADNDTAVPVPQVQLATTTSGEERVYGALATFNAASNRVGVITRGVVPFRSIPTADVAASIGKGVVGGHASNGQVAAGTAGGDGTGVIVGRGTDILWVDLDAEQAKV